jgi:hypothetical protein
MPARLTEFQRELRARAQKLTSQYRRRKTGESHGVSHAQAVRIKKYVMSHAILPARIHTGIHATVHKLKRPYASTPRKPRKYGPKRQPSEWNKAVSAEYYTRKLNWIAGHGHKPTIAGVAHALSGSHVKKTRRKKAPGEARKKRSDAGKKRGTKTVLSALFGVTKRRRRRTKY